MDVFLEAAQRAWYWFLAQPPAVLNALLPWHLPLLLCVLGLLAAVGLHRLLSMFWHRGRVFRWLFGSLLLGVLAVSLQIWLLAYLVLSQGDAFIQQAAHSNHPQSAARQVGLALLSPIFSPHTQNPLPNRAENHAQALAFTQIKAKLQSLGALEYQREVAKHLRPLQTISKRWVWGPNALASEGGTAAPPLHEQWFAELALYWMIHIEPRLDNPKPLPSRLLLWLGEGFATQANTPGEWERLAGERFLQTVFAQVLSELLLWGAGAVSVVVLGLNGLMLWFLRLCMGWFGVSAASKKPTAAKAAKTAAKAAKKEGVATTPATPPTTTIPKKLPDTTTKPTTGKGQVKPAKAPKPAAKQKHQQTQKAGQPLMRLKTPLGVVRSKSVQGMQQGSKWAVRQGKNLGAHSIALGKGFLQPLGAKIKQQIKKMEMPPPQSSHESPRTAKPTASPGQASAAASKPLKDEAASARAQPTKPSNK